ncbi:MAG: DJ-1/PfpI family protein [Candidatus Micrarchaeia archaeon]
MKIAIVIPPKDFRDESISVIKLILEKWGIQDVITSYTAKECVGKHGAVYKPAINTVKVTPQEFDGIILIDGEGIESYRLYDFRPLLDLVRDFSAEKKVIAGIGNAVKIIARANVIADAKISAQTDEESQRLIRIYHGINSEEAVEFDKNILTARNAEDAEAFAQMLVKKLKVS